MEMNFIAKQVARAARGIQGKPFALRPVFIFIFYPGQFF
jgi:hypothetical protein